MSILHYILTPFRLFSYVYAFQDTFTIVSFHRLFKKLLVLVVFLHTATYPIIPCPHLSSSYCRFPSYTPQHYILFPFWVEKSFLLLWSFTRYLNSGGIQFLAHRLEAEILPSTYERKHNICLLVSGSYHTGIFFSISINLPKTSYFHFYVLAKEQSDVITQHIFIIHSVIVGNLGSL